MERRLAAIFALDMVGYSRLMEGDEAGTLSRQKTYRTELIDPSIANHHGRVVKGTGDGLLAEFASAVDAVECAAEIQRAMPDLEKDVPSERKIQFRIGINVGDIVAAEDGDIYGEGVNVAARIESLADHGGVFVSGSAFSQVKGKVELGFEDMGPHTVKNIDEPVHVYRVLLDPGAAGSIPGQTQEERPEAPAAAPARSALRWSVPGGLLGLPRVHGLGGQSVHPVACRRDVRAFAAAASPADGGVARVAPRCAGSGRVEAGRRLLRGRQPGPRRRHPVRPRRHRDRRTSRRGTRKAGRRGRPGPRLWRRWRIRRIRVT